LRANNGTQADCQPIEIGYCFDRTVVGRKWLTKVIDEKILGRKTAGKKKSLDIDPDSLNIFSL